MKKYLFITVMALFLAGSAANAQNNKAESKKEEKLKDKEKKLNEYDEIIIKRKDDKDAKVTVEIKDDQVMVNGKPIDDYVNDEVSVRLRSPQRFNLNLNGDSPFRYREAYPGGDDQAFLGVMTEGSSEGARITVISENSAASKAGLKTGDIITKVNDKPVFDHEQLTGIISKMKPEEKIDIEYKRDGKTSKASAILGRRQGADMLRGFTMPRVPGPPGAPNPPMAPLPPLDFNFDGRDFGDAFRYHSNGKPRLGIRAQDMEEGKGAKVLDVDDESPAETAGIKENDIITSFDGKEVTSVEELAKASRESKDKSSVEVKLKRDGKSKTITLKIPKKLKTAEL